MTLRMIDDKFAATARELMYRDEYCAPFPMREELIVDIAAALRAAHNDAIEAAHRIATAEQANIETRDGIRALKVTP